MPGRPEWIPNADSIKKVEEYAARGLTKTQIAHCLGISYETFNEKTKAYSDFSDAVKRGLDKGIAHVAKKLIDNADSGNVSAQIFFLKARAKWSDNAAVDELHAKIDAITQAMEVNKHVETDSSKEK